MLTEIDERKGLVKSTWKNVRHRVQQVEPEFTRLVDELSPDHSFPVFLAYYPYGAIVADTISPFMPNMDSTSYRLTDPNIPKDVVEHLGYGKHSLPLGLVLDKHIEYFVDLPEEKITIPWVVYDAGKIFPFAILFHKKINRNYAPNGVLTTTAGARSCFMLPNIGCATNHINIQREFNIHIKTPKSLYEHWYIFKEIVNSKIINSNWRCVILFFSEQWLKKINTDKGWLKLRSYLLELSWERFDHDRSKNYYDVIFSFILNKRNLKPNPYLTDTARQLFSIALGGIPGYYPAINEDAVPVNTLQKIYLEMYGLKNYPTILQSKNYNFEDDTNPIYYSLQNSSTLAYSPKSRRISSTLFELRELEYIVRIFSEELSKKNSIGSDTILHEMAKSIKFQYFHNELDRHSIIQSSSKIIELDKNFKYPQQTSNTLTFSEDAKFLRGCISMGK